MCICTLKGANELPRCKKKRCCRTLNGEKIFKPIEVPCNANTMIEIEADEFEAICLCDLEDCNQITAGEKMGVSRGTIQRLLTSGRKKLTTALLYDKVIVIKQHFEEEK